MSKNPLFLFTPGAWHKGLTFCKVINKFVTVGYEVEVLSFPSNGSNPPPMSLDEDIAVVRGAVIDISDAGKDIVIVSHSWSALPVSSALDGLSKEERKKEGKPGGVVKLIFLAAFVIPAGISLFDAMGGVAPPIWDIQGNVIFARDPIYYFYHDLPEEEAKTWASMLQPFAKASCFSKTTGAAYLKIPSVYVLCEKDQGVIPPVQEALIKAAQDAGADMKVERIAASHSPFLSKPDETVEIILRSVSDV